MNPQQDTVKEYQIKAVFLFNFTQFVEWPKDAFPEPNAPFVIGIVGQDPFGSYLDETIRGENLKNHPLEVRRFQSLHEVDHCHILFISYDDRVEIERSFKRVMGKPVLTVGDAADFAVLGGMIHIVTDGNKTRFQINLEAARQANVVISSKFLKLADIVETQPH
jgi:hypothetical protein